MVKYSTMVRVRFAPSPTGELHVGGARTALYNYLFAKQQNGKFIIRIEDTDQERYVEGSLERLLSGLKWLGINWDEGPDIGGPYGPYLQSERLTEYHKYAQELVNANQAYYCFCSTDRLDKLRVEQSDKNLPTKYDRCCLSLSADEVKSRLENKEPYVIRLKVPAEDIVFDDLIRGQVTVNGSAIDDQVLIKSDGYPTYHLANVVDDHQMEITHVIRGEEWLPSTPKHILLYRAFGWTPPVFAHLPNVLNEQKSKLSKRKDGEKVWVQTYEKQGYLPQALVNFLALLGWHPQDDQELFSLNDLAGRFDIHRVQKAGAIFNLEKLHWFNNLYIKNLSLDELDQQLKPYYLEASGKPELNTETIKITQLIQPRLILLSDAIKESAWFWLSNTDLDANILIPKKGSAASASQALLTTIKAWKNTDAWEIENLKSILFALVDQGDFTKGELLWPVRVGLSHSAVSPDVFEMAWALGKNESLARLESAQLALSKLL